MADDAPTTPDLSNAALLIAAHGSPGSKGGRTSTRKLAHTISEMGIFGKVAAGFLTEKPFANDVLNTITAPDVYVVPNMTANGYIATHKLPQALSLTGKVTERIGSQGRQRVFLTEPVGTHPLGSRIGANCIKAAMEGLCLEDHDTCVVLIGHGSTKSRESFMRTQTVASELTTFGLTTTVVTAFLEEAPLVKDWRELTDAQTVVFVPFLISDGFHASKDIPLGIGFDPGDATFQDTLAQGGINETTQDGRRIIYLPPTGDEPDMVEIVLARVRQASAKP